MFIKSEAVWRKSRMAARLSVFSATLGSSKTVYEHKQLPGKEKSRLVTKVTVRLTNKEISSIQLEKEMSVKLEVFILPS